MNSKRDSVLGDILQGWRGKWVGSSTKFCSRYPISGHPAGLTLLCLAQVRRRGEGGAGVKLWGCEEIKGTLQKVYFCWISYQSSSGLLLLFWCVLVMPFNLY